MISSVQFENIVGGFFCNIIIWSFSIYQFILLSNGENYFIYLILKVWITSKLFAIAVYLRQKNKEVSFKYFLVSLFLQSEWILAIKSFNIKAHIFGIILQIAINTFPIIICNIYLLSDQTRNINDSYYVVIIFIYYFFIGTAIIMSVGQNLNISDIFKIHFVFPSVTTNFCYWYLFVQSLNFSIKIGLSILSINLIILLIDMIFLLEEDKQNEEENNLLQYFYKIFQYLLQFNNYLFSNYKVNSFTIHHQTLSLDQLNYQVSLKPWYNLLPLLVQCINVIALLIIKLIFYPLIIQTDKAFYVFFFLSIPQFYLLIVNIYYKLTKQNMYHSQLRWKGGRVDIQKKIFELLEDRFTISYHVELIVDSSCLEKKNLKYFFQSLLQVKDLIKKAAKKQLNSAKIIIKDIDEQYYLLFEFQNIYNSQQQQFFISNNFFENKKNEEMLKYLSHLLLKKKQTSLEINDNEIEKIYLLTQYIQSFKIINYNIKTSQLLANYFEQLKELDQIRLYHYQILSFNKIISQHINTNPKQVLFDLFEELS